MTGRDQAYLRGQLASVGIVLDPAVPSTATAPTRPQPAEVDPDEVRAILVAAGAPADQLEWLVRSCPSIDAARGYRPPPTYRWCASCDGVAPCDPTGRCIPCQGDEDA